MQASSIQTHPQEAGQDTGGGTWTLAWTGNTLIPNHGSWCGQYVVEGVKCLLVTLPYPRHNQEIPGLPCKSYSVTGPVTGPVIVSEP